MVEIRGRCDINRLSVAGLLGGGLLAGRQREVMDGKYVSFIKVSFLLLL